MRPRLRLCLLILPLTGAVRLAGQSAPPQPPPADMQRANDLFNKADWPGTLAAYGAIAKSYPGNALAHFRMGVSYMELGRFADAEKSLREGERLGVAPANAAFRLAQLFAVSRRPDDAIAELNRAIKARAFVGQSAVETDPHFASLVGHPQWHAVLDGFDAIVRPCMHDARFREFDFWVGDWDVNPTGGPPLPTPARNTVTLEDNGCVVAEHWKAPSGSEGQSFNIFDRSYGVWRQTWVDNIGGQHDYRGSLQGGNMVFTGDTPAPNGARGRIPTRLTFFHISQDSVRQFSETSPDSGKTWQVSYDLMYVRRKP
ncbi:MAG TPA: tetratricopeptide repeat protein [Gemmatimonadaceae bacterium]|nr:tetratricopeptide repeat protein [Gemmatimonadaceae bacterium]